MQEKGAKKWGGANGKVPKGHLVMDMTETIQAFVKKLENWHRKIPNGNVTRMLPHLCSVTGTVGADLQTLMLEHIQELQNQFRHYFPDLDSSSIARMVRNPLTADVTSISDDDDDTQSELLALQTDGDAKMKFEVATSLQEFWCSIGLSYPQYFYHVIIVISTSATNCRARVAAIRFHLSRPM